MVFGTSARVFLQVLNSLSRRSEACISGNHHLWVSKSSSFRCGVADPLLLISEANADIRAVGSAIDVFGYSSPFRSNRINFPLISSSNCERDLREIAELYGSQSSLTGIQEYRSFSGLQSISSTCFKAARIVAILIDDGIEFDKKHEIEWHRKFAPVVGRILRIERLAEKILDEVRYLNLFIWVYIVKRVMFVNKNLILYILDMLCINEYKCVVD
ncbi:glutamine synthetase [Sarracenia purpurea var. burkii]